MYNNNIVNFLESTTILNACTKKVWKLIEGDTYKVIFQFVPLPKTWSSNISVSGMKLIINVDLGNSAVSHLDDMSSQS